MNIFLNLALRIQFNSRLLQSVLAVGIAASSSAYAGEPADTVRKWGLIGEWSTDCSLPSSERRAITVVYRIDMDGSALYESGIMRSTIQSAIVTSEGLLSITTFNPKTSETRVNVVGREAAGIRALMNRSDKNEYSIRDGRFVGSGEASKVMKRCK